MGEGSGVDAFQNSSPVLLATENTHNENVIVFDHVYDDLASMDVSSDGLGKRAILLPHPRDRNDHAEDFREIPHVSFCLLN